MDKKQSMFDYGWIRGIQTLQWTLSGGNGGMTEAKSKSAAETRKMEAEEVQAEGVSETTAWNLDRMSLPSKGVEYWGITKKRCVNCIPLKVQSRG